MASLAAGQIMHVGAEVNGNTISARSTDPEEPAVGLKNKVDHGSAKAATKDRPKYARDQVIFKLVTLDDQRSGLAIEAQKVLQQVTQRYSLNQTAPVFAKSMRGPLKHIYLARLPNGVSPTEVCKQLQSDPANVPDCIARGTVPPHHGTVAARTTPKHGDIYLDDAAHHALSTKFGVDWVSEGRLDDDLADDEIKALMLREER